MVCRAGSRSTELGTLGVNTVHTGVHTVAQGSQGHTGYTEVGIPRGILMCSTGEHRGAWGCTEVHPVHRHHGVDTVNMGLCTVQWMGHPGLPLLLGWGLQYVCVLASTFGCLLVYSSWGGA